MKRMLFALLGFACLALAPAAVAAQESAGFQDNWGVLAKVAGRSGVSDTGNTKVRWYWVEPGRMLKVELRRAKDDVLFRESTITLGSTPGTLVVASTPVGMAPEPSFLGHVQADGRVFMHDGAPVPDGGHLIAMPDGTDELVYSGARFSGGAVVPNREDDRKLFHFLLDPLAPGRVAQAQTAQTAQTAPVAALEHPRGAVAQALLERLITGMFAGEPPVADLTDRVVETFAGKKAPPLPVWLGPVTASRLEQVSDDGNDFRFVVEHANGRANWVIKFADGTDRIENFVWAPLPPYRVRPIAIGEEVAGFLQHGVTGKYGPDIPVAAFRFAGRQGQRVCARVGSVDAYTHVYLAESLDPSAAPLFSSWLPPYTDAASPQTPWNRHQGTSFLATLPKTGEYVVYVMAHGQGTERTYSGREYKQYQRGVRADTKGRYALKLWDADAPEPPSFDDELARTQHPDSANAIWLGNIRYILESPFVGFHTPTAFKFERADGTLLQHQVQLETGNAFPDRVFVATGRRGEYRWAREAGGTLQVQCDGNWTLATGGEVLRFGLYGGNGEERRYEIHRVKAQAPYAHSPAAAPLDYVDTWQLLTDANVAETLDYLEGERDLARQTAERRARNAAEDRANQAAMMRGILGGFARGLAEEAADQQYAQEQFEGGVAGGQRQGLALRRAQQASDALARMSEPTPPTPSAPVAAPSGGGADDGSTARGDEPAKGGAIDDTGSGAPATVAFAKGFLAPITPGATSNEMCFTRVTVGPVATGDGREGRAKAAAADAEQRFLDACRALGALSHGDFADEWHVDGKADSAYASWRANRWMHEVDVD